jgi:hypothetical protein
LKRRRVIIPAIAVIFLLAGPYSFAQEAAERSLGNPPGLTFYLGGSFLSAMGEFNNMVDFGYGLSGGILLHGILFPQSVINLAGGFFTYNPSHEAIEGFMQYKGGLFLGYAFDWGSAIELTPYAGLGYYFHNPEGSNPTYDWRIYNDLFFGIKFECAYHLGSGFSIRLTPEYDIFFEQGGNSGGIFSIDVALAYSFNFPKTQGQAPGTGKLISGERKEITADTAGLVFAPNEPTLVENNEQDQINNRLYIDALAAEIKKYPDYRIVITGHAVNLFWYDKQEAAREEKNLETLSKARAELVKNELVKRGIDRSRITTLGMGGKKPLFPFSDLRNQWKNRRVELMLIKD